MAIGRFGTSLTATVMVVMLVVLSFSATNVSAKSEDRVLKIVETRDVNGIVDIKVPTRQNLWDFYSALPSDVQDCIEALMAAGYLDPALWLADNVETIQVQVDGKAHINIMAWERNGALDVNCHFAWHGEIVFTLIPRDTLVLPVQQITLDIKNAQFMMHATIASETSDITDLMINVHVNGYATIAAGNDLGGSALELDVSFHVLLKISNSELQMLKIWVPSWLDAMLAGI
ncbi:MAG: hypothetical protein LUO84_05440 [Methanomassiliicoccales archaeon]|nr:hypothetical protein [Methanomassiliicoccales archaeon]